jgi:hypothetical protein
MNFRPFFSPPVSLKVQRTQGAFLLFSVEKAEILVLTLMLHKKDGKRLKKAYGY